MRGGSPVLFTIRASYGELGNLQGLVSAREAQASIIADSEPLRRSLEEVQGPRRFLYLTLRRIVEKTQPVECIADRCQKHGHQKGPHFSGAPREKSLAP